MTPVITNAHRDALTDTQGEQGAHGFTLHMPRLSVLQF